MSEDPALKLLKQLSRHRKILYFRKLSPSPKLAQLLRRDGLIEIRPSRMAGEQYLYITAKGRAFLSEHEDEA